MKLTPLLLFVVTLVSGTVWLARPVTRDFGQIVQPATPPPSLISAEPPPPPHGPAEQPNIEALKAELVTARVSVRDQVSSISAAKTDVQLIQSDIEKLRAELQELEARRASLEVRPTDQTGQIHELETVITDRREQASQLQKQIEQDKIVVQGKVALPPRIVRAVEPVNKLPVLIELYQNHLTPVNKQYFHFPTLSLKSVFIVSRKKMGEMVSEARQPASEFSKFLSKIKPQQEYVSCLLNPDSFEAFYAAREMARKSGIEIGWDPANTSNGAIKIAGVELGSESDKKKIEVPDVVR